MEYFKIFDHQRNVSKIDLSVSPKSVLEFRTQKFTWHHFGFVKNREIFQNIWPSKKRLEN